MVNLILILRGQTVVCGIIYGRNKMKKLIKKLKNEWRYYPARVRFFKSLWVWGERRRKHRSQKKHRLAKRVGRRQFERRKNHPAFQELLRISKCALCKTLNDLTFDHIQPLAHGGDNNLANIQILCSTCNNQKDNHMKDPENCPFCQAELKGVSDSWGMSPEGWAQSRESHDKNHSQ